MLCDNVCDSQCIYSRLQIYQLTCKELSHFFCTLGRNFPQLPGQQQYGCFLQNPQQSAKSKQPLTLKVLCMNKHVYCATSPKRASWLTPVSTYNQAHSSINNGFFQITKVTSCQQPCKNFMRLENCWTVRPANKDVPLSFIVSATAVACKMRLQEQ